MLKTVSSRQAYILEIVRDEGFASIEQLATRFDVTQQTIRRVVNALCDQGLLRRMHGGVSLPVQNQNLAYGSRQGLNADAKRRIAHATASFIPDGASLMIGLGTTPEYVAQALSRRQDLRVITNNLNVAAAFAQNPDVEITIAGGTLRSLDRDIVGEAAARFFSGYRADYGIFGVGGVDQDGTLLDFHIDEVLARQSIVVNSRIAVLVADTTKFGRNATVRGGHLADCNHLFTDGPLPPAFTPVGAKFAERIHTSDAARAGAT
ncbi:DeoR/GlpR transcriptional regulator [Bradyrhizobium sp. 24]|uniref:DeoR/GlpR family DNA-binding transcription regulator n=1 Tax=unclassified Bradyrhizobium TaxID=2631580 RepID=UPI001FFBCBCB|nr:MULTISPECIES: DeoR/GlpR family DNA-binding transcription regulator [unclassified Bradyrhizobium]MCK1302806.1 DeoR/GlpR transcriptional regulator [Bradyrhizobium sp. 37]MCK1380442.1 DeoR/GlpR transcriptional regulator [Bradyrhizobium sp. 24]MCK1770839.1 DeoR/GlpR transcriptional regulator [Bradyrhizobium sp. 134]